MNKEEADNLPYELFEAATRERTNKVLSIHDGAMLEREYKNLLKDEASRNHFLMLLFAVVTSVGVMKKSGNPIPREELMEKGGLELVKYLIRASVVQDYIDGKLK